MITAFRLVKKKYTWEAFSGEGSRLFGGRWNRKGTSVVYLSDTLALAALEQFIHLGRQGLHISFVYFDVVIPDSVSIASVEAHALPKDWRREPPPDSTQDLGTRWAESGSSALVRVPSAVVPVGFNYLLNIKHPDVKKIKTGDPKPFTFNSRMWK
jgi:RES domain-containing protein